MLLSKCLNGTTQNANQALNAIIWSRVPKRTFVGKSTLEIGTYSAVLSYNDGAKGVLDVYHNLDCTERVQKFCHLCKTKIG